MTQKSGLFNSVSGDRSYSDIDVATYISLLSQGHGVIADYLNDLEVTEGTGLQVLVNTGGAWLGDPAGWWYINDSQEALTLDAEVTGLSRIDRIVIRLDRNTDTRSCTLCVLKGIAHTSPAVHNLTQNEMVFEISLAQVLITGGSMDISITDERGSGYCPYLYRNNNVINRPVIDSGVLIGDCVIYDTYNNKWISSEKGIGIYDSSKVVLFGKCKSIPNLLKGLTYYAGEFADKPNVIINPQFDDGTTSWLPSRCTIAASNNILTCTITGTDSFCFLHQYTNTPIVVGNTVYFKTKVRVLNEDCAYLRTLVDGSNAGTSATVVYEHNPIVNQWYTLSGTVVIPADFEGDLRVLILQDYNSAESALGSVMEVDGTGDNGVLLVDLTETYGAGNEPTKEECDVIFSRNLTTKATGNKIGYAVSDTEMMVNIQGDWGIDSEYTDDMVQFNAIPAYQGKTLLKIEKPASADGVMIRCSTTAYDGSGITWGDEVINLTDDSNYHGDNKFYLDIARSDKYYKAFPYKNSNYNIVSGMNEVYVKKYWGYSSWTGDNISGSVIVDDFLTYGMNASNIVYSSAKVGNGMSLTGSSSRMFRSAFLPRDGFTYTGWVYFNGSTLFPISEARNSSDGGLLRYYGWDVRINASGSMTVRGGGHGEIHEQVLNTQLAAGNWHMITIYVNANTRTFKVRINDNDTLFSAVVDELQYSAEPVYTVLGALQMGSTMDAIIGYPGLYDQIRIYDGDTTDIETCRNLYNGGAGC